MSEKKEYHSSFTGPEVDALLTKVKDGSLTANVDSSLSTESENPVMNKVITEELAKLSGEINGHPVVLEGEKKLGNLNIAGGITASSLSYYKVYNVDGLKKIVKVKSTSNSQYSTLWALYSAPYDETFANFIVKGDLASVAQSAVIDLSLYPSAAILYVAVGSVEGADAEVTYINNGINERIDEIEFNLEKVSKRTEELSEKVADLEEESGEEEKISVYLPNVINVVVGDNMQIYWRSIISAANPYIFDIYAVCSVGKSFPRYYEFKPTAEMVGKSYNFDVYVKTNDGTIVAQKTATIKVAATMDSPSSTKNILCIGASATAGGQWVGELNRRLTATSGDGTPSNPTGLGLSNIAFVGRKVGTANAIHLEATGGWRVQEYASKGQRAIRFFVTGVDTISLSSRYSCNGTTYVVQEVNVTEGVGNIRCTLENTFVTPSGKLTKLTGSGDAEITFTSYEDENFSPFWNAAESRIDFQQYADSYCDGHIDCLIWHCGVNDITSGDPVVIPSVIAAFRNLLTAYHEQFPNGKVIISSVPIGSTNGGFAANYGANKLLNYYTFAKIAQLYAQTLIELTQEGDFMDFVAYSPALEQFDAENNYPVKDVAVNNRSSIKEKQGTNALHPTIEGSYQVADAIYRVINTILQSEPGNPDDGKIVASAESIYITKGLLLNSTTSPRGVISFRVTNGNTYELYIPKTGNEYAVHYAFGNSNTNGAVEAGIILTAGVGEGNEQPATHTITVGANPYLYVCYTLDGGVPTLKKL